jgi:hypothetical protein
MALRCLECQYRKGFRAADRKTGDSGAAVIARTGPGRVFV